MAEVGECKHENLLIETLERVGQRYWNSPNETDDPWGKTTYQDIVSLEAIQCLDCDQDVTEELRGKIQL